MLNQYVTDAFPTERWGEPSAKANATPDTTIEQLNAELRGSAFVRCQHCKKLLPEKRRGRPQKFCSDRCRQAHRKIGLRTGNVLRYRTGRLKPKAASQDSDFWAKFQPQNLSQKTNFRFERVNEVTFKVTDGTVTSLPASHGKWGGYRTAKAMAWIVNLGPNQWLARCGDRASGPSVFNEAKANALAMARGACGDYFIENPIDQLNGLQARLLDRDGEAE